MKVIFIILILITQITITLHINAYDFLKLDWSWSKKNMCSSNIQKAIWLDYSIWNAKDWIKHTDKTNENYIPIPWDIAVIDKHNYTLRNHKMGWTYWHVWIIWDIDYINKELWMYDWPNAYYIKRKFQDIDGYITESKMKELGANNIN